MSSTNNQQQKDASSSNSTQPSLSSAASGSNNCAKTEDKTSQGKKPRGPRAGSKRHQHEAGQRHQQRQLIRYNRDTLLQMRDSRLSSAWPRALNRAYVGDGGLWDPVKLFEGERKSAFDGKTKIERVRNVRGAAMVQPSYSSGPSAEDSQSFGRSSRRRKRTKEEAASPAASSTQRQRGWPPGNAAETQQAAKSAEPAADGRKEPRDDVARGFGPSRLGGGGSAGGFVRRSDRPATAGGVGGGGFGSGRGGPGVSGRWERSQGLRDPQGLRGGFQPPRHRPAEEEELPAWFDEGPLDKMEKLELTGLPEDMEAAEGDGGSKKTEATQQQQQQKQQPLDGLGLGSSSFESGGSSSSRFAKWLAVDEPSQPQPQPPTAEAGQRDGAQQQLERIFQDMRGRHGHETNQQPQTAPNVGPSLMHLLRPPQPPPPPPPQRPLHAQEVEANLKSMLFGSEAAAPPPPPPAAVAAASSEGSAMPVLPPNGQARTLEEIESSLGAASSGSDRSSRGSKDSRAIYKLIGDLQVQMHDAASASSAGGRQASVPPLFPGGRQAPPQHQQPPQQQQPPQPPPQQPPQSKPLQPTAAPFIAQHPLPPRSQPPPQPPTAQPMFSSGASSQAAAAAAAAAAQRRLPMPMQAQQLQQLQAMLLSNLQMQAQMMHSSQISGGPGNKAHTLNKLLPQQLFHRPPHPYLLRNNALQGTRLLNQHFNQAGAAADFAGLETAAGADAAFRRPATSAAAAAASANLSTSSASQQAIAQPAMPIVPPMLLPPKTSSAATSATAAAAGLQGWGGAHNSQLSAMLWNATRLAASVKSANTSTGWSSLHRSPPVDSGVGQPHRPPTKQPVDEMPSA